MATIKTAGNKTDLPPKGNRNPDPFTGETGAHPIETGVGAALGGAGAGFAAGMVAGPVGAAVGTVVGAVAGGLAGKEVGEVIDPTLEQTWLQDYYETLDEDDKRPIEDYQEAYHYGLTAKAQRQNVPFDQVEDALQDDWDRREGSTVLGWDEVEPAIRHAYSRPYPFNRNPNKSR